MKSGLLALIATVFTFLAVMMLVIPFAAPEGWELDNGLLVKFGLAFLILGVFAGASWYASGLGRKDNWPR